MINKSGVSIPLGEHLSISLFFPLVSLTIYQPCVFLSSRAFAGARFLPTAEFSYSLSVRSLHSRVAASVYPTARLLKL